MTQIGFIGLGQMGSPMASNILKGGYPVAVYDVNSAAVAALVERGAVGCNSIAEVAKQAEILITMLPNGALVKEVLLGKEGVADYFNAAGLLIDMSTISPFETDMLIQQLAERGLNMIDAPVGRTSDHAIAGSLLIMAGGSEAQIQRAEPIFNLMGSDIVHAGGAGKGIRIKIINNYMSIALNALSAEAMVLAEAIGVSVDEAMTVMSGTPAGKGHFTTSWPNKVLKGDLSPAFMVDLAHKDLGIALDLANQVKVPVMMGAASRELYNLARAAGRGRQDWTALFEQLRISAGLMPNIC